MAATVTFSFTPSFGQAIPAWGWQDKFHAQIDVDDLAELFGPPGDRTPHQLVEQNRAAIEEAASRKLARFTTPPPSPLKLTIEDFTV